MKQTCKLTKNLDLDLVIHVLNAMQFGVQSTTILTIDDQPCLF